MPVSIDHQQTKPCRQCEEGSHGDSVYWNIQLDQDLLSTIVSIYPQWFKGLKSHSFNNMAQRANASTITPSNRSIFYPKSPPNAEVDESPLQKFMDRNKESLKVKLMLRRPINQLVAQGIMPSDVGHVDPSLAERQRMLKKCRLADSLNDQLSHRPGPLELIKKNILHTEESIERAVKEGHIEFKATYEGQKAKPDPPDQYMIIDDDSHGSDAHSPRDDQLFYSAESPASPSSPSNHSRPSQIGTASFDTGADLLRSCSSDLLKTAAAQAGIVTMVVAPTATSPLSLGSTTSSLSPLSSIASPLSVSCSNNAIFSCSSPAAFTTATKASLPALQQQPASGKEKNRKISKSKTQHHKHRPIKFHEYKGPPSAQKPSDLSSSSNVVNTSLNPETSYELLLQQQQLFLQWQLENKQKYPQIMLPVAEQSPSSPSNISLPSPSPSISSQEAMDHSSESSTPPPVPPPPPPLPPPPHTATLPAGGKVVASKNGKPLRNLEDMKVSDLKAELKRRNLRVSGAKTHLIQRLKSYGEPGITNSGNNHTNSNIVQSNFVIPFNDESIPDSSVPSPMPHVSQTSLAVEQMPVGSCTKLQNLSPNQQAFETSVNKISSSVELTHLINSNVADATDEDIILEQQRKIEELQKQLLNSQLLLQQHKQQQQVRQQSQTFQPQQAVNAKANLAAFLQQQQLNQALAQQQQKLQIQIQQQQQQMQQVAMNIQNTAQKIGHKVAVTSVPNTNIVRNTDGRPNNMTNAGIRDGHIAPSNGKNKQTSNTVILGEHPATLLLNHVVKSEGQNQRTTSLPNFVGTFVQPQIVLSSQGMKQLVFSQESLIVPEHIRMSNEFSKGTILTNVTTSYPKSTVNLVNAIPEKEIDSNVGGLDSANKPNNNNNKKKKKKKKENNNNNATSSTKMLFSNNNFVTLHISEDHGNVKNRTELSYHQDDDISKLFKQENVIYSQNVDDVLDLLMKNGEFDPPEANTIMQQQQQTTPEQPLLPDQHHQQLPQPLYHLNKSATQPINGCTNDRIDSSIPSQHLSLEELGIEMESFPMDLNENRAHQGNTNSQLMDIDSDWLDRLISSELEPPATNNAPTTSSAGNGSNGIVDPLDLFSIDDNDFKVAAEFSWDRVDCVS